MTVVEALKQARAAGLRIELDGEDLVLSAAAAPPDSVVRALAQHKSGLLALLRAGACGWTAEDWGVYFDERAAIREHDSGLARPKAERLAFEDTLEQWLSLHPAAVTSPDRCAHCGQSQRSADVLLPMLTLGGHAWIHNRCWTEWYGARRREAVAALSAIALVAPTSCGDQP